MSSPSCGLTLPKTLRIFLQVSDASALRADNPTEPSTAADYSSDQTGLHLSNIRRKGRSGCPAATAVTLAWSFFKSGPCRRVDFGMFGSRLNLPPLVPGQQPIHGRIGHGAAYPGFVAEFEAAGGAQPPCPGVFVQRLQQRPLLWQGEFVMAGSPCGPYFGRRPSHRADSLTRPAAHGSRSSRPSGRWLRWTSLLWRATRGIATVGRQRCWGRQASRDESRQPARREFQSEDAYLPPNLN